MRERLAEIFLSAVDAKDRRLPVRLLRLFLRAVSVFYLGVISLNPARRKKRLSCPVISVGNLVLGGTGKTPAVELLARMIVAMGKKVAILSRGYGRKPGKGTSALGIVSDGKEILLDAQEGGDEPQLLARNLPGVAVLVGRNRLLSGNHAIANFGTEVVILDDGFQYTPLMRDLDIVAIDAQSPFGNGYLFPGGSLREPVYALRRADIFLLTHTEPDGIGEKAKRQLQEINPRAPILESIHMPVHLQDTVTGGELQLSFLKGREIVAFSSIANPVYFENTLVSLGANIRHAFRFPDHHNYRAIEVRKIFSVAIGQGVRAIVTTQKDAVRLERFKNIFAEPVGGGTSATIRVLALMIELKIVNGKERLEKSLYAILKHGS